MEGDRNQEGGKSQSTSIRWRSAGPCEDGRTEGWEDGRMDGWEDGRMECGHGVALT